MVTDIVQNVKNELHSVWWERGEFLAVGSHGVTRIVLVTDGCGPMGSYDRIHVFRACYGVPPSDVHEIHTAHNVFGFRLAEPEQTP